MNCDCQGLSLCLTGKENEVQRGGLGLLGGASSVALAFVCSYYVVMGQTWVKSLPAQPIGHHC